MTNITFSVMWGQAAYDSMEAAFRAAIELRSKQPRAAAKLCRYVEACLTVEAFNDPSEAVRALVDRVATRRSAKAWGKAAKSAMDAVRPAMCGKRISDVMLGEPAHKTLQYLDRPHQVVVATRRATLVFPAGPPCPVRGGKTKGITRAGIVKALLNHAALHDDAFGSWGVEDVKVTALVPCGLATDGSPAYKVGFDV